MAVHFLFMFAEGTFYAVAFLFLLLLLLAILRKKWLAIAGFWVLHSIVTGLAFVSGGLLIL